MAPVNASIQDLTPSIRELLPSLMGGARNLEDDTFLRSEVIRPLCAQDETPSTYVVSANYPESTHRWFGQAQTNFPVREGNETEFYIDGDDTYQAMVEAIATATEPDHFIILIGWAAHFDFVLSRKGFRAAGARQTAAAVFGEKARQGVKLRLLLWHNTLPIDVDAFGTPYYKLTKKIADNWNDLAPSEVPRRSITIIDGNTRSKGSHHQKILLVYGNEGLIGFAGGVDFNSDRVNKEKLRVAAGPGWLPVSGPLHDVHVRVRGKAAEDLLLLAVERWNAAKPVDVMSHFNPKGLPSLYSDPGLPTPGSQLPPTGKEIEDLSRITAKALASAAPVLPPSHIVQIAQTVGNPDIAKARKNDAWAAIKHAIGTAQKFIYVEDQYFWSRDAARALIEAAERVRHISILTCSDAELGIFKWARHAMLQQILREAPSASTKLRIYERIGTTHAYIHAKMSIFDDELAIVGSANWNDRGFYYDSEVIAAIADPEWREPWGSRLGAWYSMELNAARNLRIRLWAEHLGLSPERVADGVAAEAYWRLVPVSANVKPYLVDGVHWADSPSVNDGHFGAEDPIVDPGGPGG